MVVVSPTVETIKRLTAPSLLRCSSVDFGVLKNRIELPARHLFHAAAEPASLVAVPDARLRELLLWHDGFTLFDATQYGESGCDDGGGLRILSIAESRDHATLLSERVALNKKFTVNEWHEWLDAEGTDPTCWIEGLYPFALLGGTGDLVALDTAGTLTDSCRVVYLDSDVIAAGPFDAGHFEIWWDSIDEFFAWFAEDPVAHLERSWRYTDSAAQQYAVDEIVWQSGQVE